MALIKCPECGRDVSSRAVTCPCCAYPIRSMAEDYYNLGIKYAYGRNVPQDYKKAAECYQKSAELGLVEAQCNLGSLYAKGRGVSQDDEKAVEWFRKAAEQGYAMAQYNLGISYEDGRGVSQDDEKAVEWYQKAAEQGYANAQRRLQEMDSERYYDDNYSISDYIADYYDGKYEMFEANFPYDK